MDRFNKPTKIAKVTAMMSSYYGVDIIYFRTQDVDMENGIVKGKVYERDKWVATKKRLPQVIDIASRCFVKETREVTDYLRENSILTYDNKNTPNKEKLQTELSKDSRFTDLVIPTQKMDSFETLEKFLEEYSSIIMKPLFGKKGLGLYSLRKKGESYLLSHKRDEQLIKYNELFQFYNDFLSGEKYILQKMIESRTIEGDPFDCRIVVQKSGEGTWEIGKIFFRVGTGQKVVSNTSHGGSMIEPKSFLKKNYGDQWEEIYKRLKKIALKLPYKIEEVKKTSTMDLGLDIGIDGTGDLYLFESNNGASLSLLTSKSAIFRLEYYKYLYNTHSKLVNQTKEEKEKENRMKKHIKELNKQHQALKQEKNQYEKEMERMKSSRSWRLTNPIRKISAYLKRG